MSFTTHNTTPTPYAETAYDFKLIAFMERTGQIEHHEANYMRAYLRNKVAM